MVDIPARLKDILGYQTQKQNRDLRVIIGYKIGVVLLDAIVKDGDDDALPSDAHLPRLLHAHVQLPASVQVPGYIGQIWNNMEINNTDHMRGNRGS